MIQDNGEFGGIIYGAKPDFYFEGFGLAFLLSTSSAIALPKS